MVDNAFAKYGQPWLTEVPFHKPMVDHGLEKLCQIMVNHGWQCFLATIVNHNHKRSAFIPCERPL